LPYKQQIHLNTLTETNAVLRGDNRTTQGGIDAVAWLLNWINCESKRVLIA